MLNIEKMDEQSFWKTHCEGAVSSNEATINTARDKTQTSEFIEYLSNNFSDEAISPFAVRFVPSFHRDLERWDIAGRQTFFAIETQSSLYTLAPVHYREEFGNVFVFFMEYFCRLITDNIDSILYGSHSLNESKDKLQNLSPFAYNYRTTYETYNAKIANISDVVQKQEALLAKRLCKLNKWIEQAEVKSDAKSFFEAYMLGYFGETIKLDSLNWWFNNKYIAS